MRSYLIVANQTLSGAHLLREVQTRSQAEECRFHVVVPATPATGHTNWTEGAAHAQAQGRLDEALAQFRAAGIEVTGEVGDESPTHAPSVTCCCASTSTRSSCRRCRPASRSG